MKVGDILQLVPRTRHAKNRVREHGCQVKVTIVKPDQFCCMHIDGEKENPRSRTVTHPELLCCAVLSETIKHTPEGRFLSHAARTGCWGDGGRVGKVRA